MVCSELGGRRRAASTLPSSDSRLRATLRYKKEASTRVYFTLASYWLIADFTRTSRERPAVQSSIFEVLLPNSTLNLRVGTGSLLKLTQHVEDNNFAPSDLLDGLLGR